MRRLNLRNALIIILSFLLILSTSYVLCGYISKADNKSEFEYKLSAEIEEEYLRDSYFHVPTLTVKFDGQDYNTTAKLVYPDNRVSGNLKNYLDVEGEYVLRYSFTVDGIAYTKDYPFEVYAGISSLFNSNQAKFTINSTTPDYMVTDEEYVGMKVSSSGNNTIVEYNLPIDLTDNSRDDLLLEFIPTPNTENIPETSVFIVKLTDVEDPDNWVKIRIGHSASQDFWQAYVGANFKYAFAGYDPYNMIGRNPGNKYSGNDGLTAGFGIDDYSKKVCANSYGSRKGYKMSSVKLYFDYLQRSLYAAPASLTNAVGDLDDINQVGAGNQWNGFLTGKAYLSIETTLRASELNYLILNVDGQDMSKYKVEDKTAPEIQIDFDGNSEVNVPYALVNKPYKIFDAISVDNLDKVSYAPQVRVYDKTTYRNLRIDNGYFIPTEVGQCVIEYKAKDSHGNVTLKEIVVDVKNNYDSDISFEFNSNLKDSILVGETFEILDGVPVGGSGVLTTKYNILKNNKLIKENVKSYKFSEDGEFTLRALVTDYLGKTETFDKNINVLSNEYPMFEMPFVADYFVTGNLYYLPSVTAYEYTRKLTGESVNVEVFANGEKLSNNCFKPTSAGDVVISYRAVSKYNASNYTEFSKTVKVVKPSGATFLADYFTCGEGVVKSVNSEDITFTTTKDEQISFINQLGIKGFSLVFNVNKDKNNFDKVDFYLTDSNNPTQKIKFSIGKADIEEAKNSKFYVNDVFVSSISGSFFGNVVNKFNFSLEQTENGLSIYDNSLGSLVCNINETMFGDSFSGFDSGTVYLQFGFQGVTGQSELILYRICNQMFNKSNSIDRMAPYIVLSGDIEKDKKVGLGETVFLPKAVAYDVLTVNPNLSLIIIDPDGNVIYNGEILEDFSFVADKYGIYSISYVSKDSSIKANETVMPYSCMVVDKVKPTIEIEEESIPTTVYVDKEYDLPTVIVDDNVTNDVYYSIAIYCPDGKVIEDVDGTFTLTQKGVHRLVYFACDEAGNSTIKTFIISAV